MQASGLGECTHVYVCVCVCVCVSERVVGGKLHVYVSV